LTSGGTLPVSDARPLEKGAINLTTFVDGELQVLKRKRFGLDFKEPFRTSWRYQREERG